MVIKAVVNQNPLSDCGNIVKGQRFIGRYNEVETIQNRILSKNGGNIAIMGLPRVGKSSLVWNALVENRKHAKENNILIIRINVGDIDSSLNFYKTLIVELYDELEDEDLLNDKFDKVLSKHKDIIFDSNSENTRKKSSIWRFYKRVAKEDINVIYILDEFDHIGAIFKLEDFQFLRELSTNPDTKIALATISRRTIHEIELIGNEALSKLSTVFQDLNLGLFTNEEVEQYWKQLLEFGIDTDTEYQNTVQYYTGNHPFLIDVFNSKMINELLIKEDIDISNSIDNLIKLTFFNLYDNIVTLLKEEKLYDKLIQILFGPKYDLDSKSIERLLKFGIIYINGKKYKCFSEFFKEYLFLKQNEIDFWPLWTETESSLRNLIKVKLSENYGENWEDKFVEKCGKRDYIEELKKMMLKNQKKFPEKASNHLVDYTNPRELYEIFISSNWDSYKDIMKGKSKKEWRKILLFLADIRNPVAHVNESFLSDTDKNLAISYCEEIIELLNI